jgi:Lon protease-like protein
MTMRIPLFPINTVLFPGGHLDLRIFEQRYLRMVSDCLSRDAPFGISLIDSGPEVGGPAVPCRIGTLVRIIDWAQRPEGLLGITVHGEQRFAIADYEADAQQLLHAEVTLLDNAPSTALGEKFQPLAELLLRILEQLGDSGRPQHAQPDDAAWVGCRLAELLPLPLREKQRLLEIGSPTARLQLLYRMLQPGADTSPSS